MLVGLGNPLDTIGNSHTSHSALLVAISIISLPFVGILNTVIIPVKSNIRPPVPHNYSNFKIHVGSHSVGAQIFDRFEKFTT